VRCPQYYSISISLLSLDSVCKCAQYSCYIHIGFKPKQKQGGVQVKNHCVGLRPAAPLAEARVTQLATTSFRDLQTMSFTWIEKRTVSGTLKFLKMSQQIHIGDSKFPGFSRAASCVKYFWELSQISMSSQRKNLKTASLVARLSIISNNTQKYPQQDNMTAMIVTNLCKTR